LNHSTFFLDPTYKDFILDFVNGRKCQLHYGIDENNNKMASKFFMLHEKNYDKKIYKIHPKYKCYPLAIHCTPARYIFYPLRAEGMYALDYVLDIDGDGYEENKMIAKMIIEYFVDHGLISWMMWRTRGKHDGIQLKVPFECFVDKVDISYNDIVEIKKFYLKLTWILNNIVTKSNAIELKIYNTTFRVPHTINETTKKHCNVIYDGGDIEYLSGEELMKRVDVIWNDPFFHKMMKKQIKFPRKKNKMQRKIRARYNINGAVKPSQFPPCFKTGIYTMVKKNTNREMIIFATWCFLRSIKWNNDSIVDFLLHWKQTCKIDDEMNFDIKEKNAKRELGGISCAYIKNQAKFCVADCGCNMPNDVIKWSAKK